LENTKQVLSFLAKFHANFWGLNNPEVTDLKDRIYPLGCWWRKYLRTSVRWENIPKAFQNLCSSFPQLFHDLDTPQNHQLIQTLYENIDQLSEQLSSKKRKTVVHGDMKSSNIFFSSSKVSVIDFQWTGFAPSGVGDIVYLICGSVDEELLNQESELLEYYYEQFSQFCKENGKIKDDGDIYCKEEFFQDYKLEFLDYFKTSLPYLLYPMNAEIAEENSKKWGWLTHEYNPKVTAWFCRRALSIIIQEFFERNCDFNNVSYEVIKKPLALEEFQSDFFMIF